MLRLNRWINNGIHLCLDILIVIFFTANCVIAELTITVLWLETSKRVVKWFGGHTISTGTGYRTVASRVLIDNRRKLATRVLTVQTAIPYRYYARPFDLFIAGGWSISISILDRTNRGRLDPSR